MNAPEAIATLEVMGFKFDLSEADEICYQYKSKRPPPPQADAQLFFSVIKDDKESALQFLKDRKAGKARRPIIQPLSWTSEALWKMLSDNIAVSESLRAQILKATNKDEALRLSLECIATMTGDEAFYLTGLNRYSLLI